MKILLMILLLIIPLLADVGKITYVKGDVLIVRDGKSSTAIPGMPLKIKDNILTKKNSLVKLIFADKTYISLGSKSDFSIEDYFYEEKKTAVAKFKINTGIFRAITGKISKLSPDRFKLKTKTVTIGIRGTIFSGVVSDDKEEIFCEKGNIYVSSKSLNIEVSKGYKTVVKRGKISPKPKAYRKSELNKINSQTSGFKNKKCKN